MCVFINKKMRAACFSGGGADGAYTVGRLKGLGYPKFDYHNGVSTGALIALLYALGRYDDLQKNFIVDDCDIYDQKAFGEGTQSFLKSFVKSALKSDMSIGSSKPLYDRVKKTLSDDLRRVAIARELVAEVGYMVDSTGKINWKDVADADYADYVCASTAVPFVMSNVVVKNNSLSDGGVVEGVGLVRAIQKGAKHVDVFMHQPKSSKFIDYCRDQELLHAFSQQAIVCDRVKKEPSSKKEKLECVAQAIYEDSHLSSIVLGLELALKKDVTVKIHWMDKEYFSSSMDFGVDKQKTLMKKGFEASFRSDLIDVFN